MGAIALQMAVYDIRIVVPASRLLTLSGLLLWQNDIGKGELEKVLPCIPVLRECTLISIKKLERVYVIYPDR
jgi:hypothetical protein